jgi:Type II site-specific deoxyribonuclease
VLSARDKDKRGRIKHLAKLLPELSESQLGWVEEIVEQFRRAYTYERDERSDLVSDCLLQEIGDALRLHHCFSREPFSKDKFEYLLERASNHCGVRAELARRGNPGHDITIGRAKFSLKTQAGKSIKRNSVHISKFMELGKGQWGDEEKDLIGLREQFFSHMKSYDRILVLRTVSKAPAGWEYELVEIPKRLLRLAAGGTLRMMHGSKQHPKPGYCDVRDAKGDLLFQLYFDGGTERKLQIKGINIDNCIVHARWSFPADDLITEG